MHDTKYRKQAMLIWAAERESTKDEWRQTAAATREKLSSFWLALKKLTNTIRLRRDHS